MHELDKTGKTKICGKTQFVMRDALTKAGGSKGKLRLFLVDDKNKFKGTFEISSFTARRFYTFFDLIFRNHLNIVPIIGVDFSMANLTMNDASFCLHTLKPGAPNDYIEALKGLHEAFGSISSFKLAYGYGARTIEKLDGSQGSCDLFSMSGDFQDPFVEVIDELLSCY